MAVSDGALFIIIAQLGLYYLLYRHKMRLWRMVGCIGMVAVGLSSVMVEDTVPAFVFAGVSIIIAGIQLFKDIASMTAG